MLEKQLPEPTGPHRIGLARYDLEDIYRKDLIYPNGRLIPILIYFPMERGVQSTYPKIFEERAALGPFEPLTVNVHSQKADLSLLNGNEHPVIFINHASCVAATDYAYLAEDLSSNGYVVISIQHDLQSDEDAAPSFWEGRSCSRNAKVIDNILYVFEWLKATKDTLWHGKIDLNRIGLIGHSLGGNSLLLWSNRTLDAFKKDTRFSLLPHEDPSQVKECLILLETTRFSYPFNTRFPLFFLLAEEREAYQKENGCYDQMVRTGHRVFYYKGSTHISFMDHGYSDLRKEYFTGTLEERKAFFDQVRQDVRNFLKECGIYTRSTS